MAARGSEERGDPELPREGPFAVKLGSELPWPPVMPPVPEARAAPGKAALPDAMAASWSCLSSVELALLATLSWDLRLRDRYWNLAVLLPREPLLEAGSSPCGSCREQGPH